jgi:hypothetical protein
LRFSVKSGAVSANFTAFFAFMNYDKAALRVGLGSDWAQKPSAIVCSVTRININVKRPKAKGTVISRACTHRQHLLAAVTADKGFILFGKSFLFHKTPQKCKNSFSKRFSIVGR